MKDPRFESIVGEYLDRLNDGQRIEPEEILIEHPKLGPAILDDLRAFLDVDATGSAIESNDEDGFPRRLADYTLRRMLGRGGMGVVYEAWEESMDRVVALKVLPPAIAADERATARFVREAQLAGRLSHPNVVGVYGMGVKESTPYFAMEYVEGETLAEILAKVRGAESVIETPFGVPGELGFYSALAKAMAAVADGLQHAHERGVVHRDIKPSNLIVGRQGALRILDFGLARLEGQEGLTLTGDVLGTPLYMSPEQARRERITVDHRTDVYSLGATMYEALSGFPPFRGRDHADTLSQIIERDPISIRRSNSGVPEELETIVLKCLRKDCGDRYGTAEALAQDLRRFTRGDPIEARPRTRWEVAFNRWNRRRMPISIGFVGLALCAAVVWLAWVHRSSERARVLERYAIEVRAATSKMAFGEVVLRRQILTRDETRPSPIVSGVPFPILREFRSLAVRSSREVLRRAAHDLARLIEAAPKRPEAYYQLGRAYRLLGEHENARSALKSCLAVDRKFVPAQYELNLLDTGSPRRSRKALLSALATDAPRWAKSWILAVPREAWDKEGASEVLAALTELIEYSRTHGDPYPGYALESHLARGRSRLSLWAERQERSGQSLRVGSALTDPAGRTILRGAASDFAVAAFLANDSLEAELLAAKTAAIEGAARSADARLERVWLGRHGLSADVAAVGAATVWASLGEFERALEWAERVESETASRRIRLALLPRMGRAGAAIRIARSALAAPSGYRDLANLYIRLLASEGASRRWQLALGALDVCDRGLAIEPNDRSLEWVRGFAVAWIRRVSCSYLSKEISLMFKKYGSLVLGSFVGVVSMLDLSAVEIVEDFEVDPNPNDCDPVCWTSIDGTVASESPLGGIEIQNPKPDPMAIAGFFALAAC